MQPRRPPPALRLRRHASFRDLAVRLSEMARWRRRSARRSCTASPTIEGLEDVIVSVTCATSTTAFVPRGRPPGSGCSSPPALLPSSSGGSDPRRVPSGLPPLTPKMRRVKSEQALAVSAQLHRHPGGYPVPMRRVQSAQELSRVQRLFQFHHRSNQCRCLSRRQDAPAPAAQPTCALPYMSKNVRGISGAEKAATARSGDAKPTMDFDKGRAIWEFE
ncbi:hypothetical protein EJB05_05115, partial [Eragrostis curvula]